MEELVSCSDLKVLSRRVVGKLRSGVVVVENAVAGSVFVVVVASVV
jgi:hypothetical protein